MPTSPALTPAAVPDGRDPGAPDSRPAADDPGLVLAWLMRRMRQRGDFPAWSASIQRVQAMAESEAESLHSLCEGILQDVALTQKLLRVVNTAHYRRAGTDPVGTVSRAVSLIGVAGVRNLALSLMLLDHLPDASRAQHLREAFLHSVMAGTLASELAATPAEAEAAYLGTLFRRLGWLLVCCHLPDEAEDIRRGAEDLPLSLAGREAEVAPQVLGIELEALAEHVGQQWGLPEGLMACMRSPGERPPARRLAGEERLHWLSSLAHAGADALLHTEPADLGPALEACQRRFALPLALPPDALAEAAGRARKRMTELTQALHLSVPRASAAERLLDLWYEDMPAAVAPEACHQPAAPAGQLPPWGLDGPDGLMGEALEAHAATASQWPRPGADGGAASRRQPGLPSPGDVLTRGIQDVTAALVEGQGLSQVLHMVLETLWRSLHCRRVILCLRDVRQAELVGRMGLGEDADVLKAAFRISLAPPGAQAADLFTLVCMKNADTLISDARAPGIAQRLPPAWVRHLDPAAFLLLPLVLKRAGQPERVIGLLYADHAEPGGLQVDEATLALLRTLRNQAVMAFMQVPSAAA